MHVKVFFRTLPYVLMRALVYAVFSVAMLLFLGIIFLIGLALNALFKGSAVPMVILSLIALGGVIGLVKLAERYVLYLVKIGHVAVVTELVTVGELPANTNQFSYGKDRVVKHLAAQCPVRCGPISLRGSPADYELALQRCRLSQRVPGVNALVSIIKAVLQIAVNYVDEAVMSYILQNKQKTFGRPQLMGWYSMCKAGKSCW